MPVSLRLFGACLPGCLCFIAFLSLYLRSLSFLSLPPAFYPLFPSLFSLSLDLPISPSLPFLLSLLLSPTACNFIHVSVSSAYKAHYRLCLPGSHHIRAPMFQTKKHFLDSTGWSQPPATALYISTSAIWFPTKQHFAD